MDCTSKQTIAMVGIVALSLVVAILSYNSMPERMASHWGIHGEVNGYMSKAWGLFLMPAISAVLVLLFIYIPKLDPLKENIEKFRKYYDNFVLLTVSFLFYIYILSILWNLGFAFNMTRMLLPAFGLLFFSAGILVGKAEMNWFIGIRNPWTLSNKKIWKKTHAIGGKVFKLLGMLTFLSVFFENYAFWIMIVSALIAMIYVNVYSYVEYKKIKQKKSK